MDQAHQFVTDHLVSLKDASTNDFIQMSIHVMDVCRTTSQHFIENFIEKPRLFCKQPLLKGSYKIFHNFVGGM